MATYICSLCSNLGGFDPEKLYRATLNRTVAAIVVVVA